MPKKNIQLEKDILNVLRNHGDQGKAMSSIDPKDYLLDVEQIVEQLKMLRVERALKELGAEGRIERDQNGRWRLRKR